MFAQPPCELELSIVQRILPRNKAQMCVRVGFYFAVFASEKMATMGCYIIWMYSWFSGTPWLHLETDDPEGMSHARVRCCTHWLAYAKGGRVASEEERGECELRRSTHPLNFSQTDIGAFWNVSDRSGLLWILLGLLFATLALLRGIRRRLRNKYVTTT